jgi:hypothetical protein
MRNRALIAGKRCVHARWWCLAASAIVSFATTSEAVTLAEKAKESGCVSKPTPVQETLYRCSTESGAFSYFNVPGISGEFRGSGTASGSSGGNSRGKSASTPSPAGFPKVDAETQKGRDDMRRKVLADELAAEEKLLAEARATFASGAPIPLPEEQASAGKYRDRIARLRQSVQLHERNVEALKKELGNTR